MSAGKKESYKTYRNRLNKGDFNSNIAYTASCFRLLLSLQPPADAGSPLADFSTLKIEAIRSS
jgi:hypothetical protein